MSKAMKFKKGDKVYNTYWDHIEGTVIAVFTETPDNIFCIIDDPVKGLVVLHEDYLKPQQDEMIERLESDKGAMKRLQRNQDNIFNDLCSKLRLHPNTDKGERLFDWLYNDFGEIGDFYGG